MDTDSFAEKPAGEVGFILTAKAGKCKQNRVIFTKHDAGLNESDGWSIVHTALTRQAKMADEGTRGDPKDLA